jgi:hypothetical protein
MKILGSALLLGPVPEQTLKDLFAGELPLFELGVRLANLNDRLLLFRYQRAGRRLIAVNPLLEAELSAKALSFAAVFGRAGIDEAKPPKAAPVDAQAAVGIFSYLFHATNSLRKGGRLTKRAAERIAALFPELVAEGGGRPGVIARALSMTGVLPASAGEERYPDREAFGRLLEEWGEDLPYYFAACLALSGASDAEGESSEDGLAEGAQGVGGGAARNFAMVVAGALESLPAGFVMPRPALARWLRIAARRSRLAFDPAIALVPLEELGIARSTGEGIALSLPAPAGAPRAARGGVLVA